jgi:magnesium chelatase subunit I
LVATANPVDYTTAGKIVEPLLDRFGSGIPTHYPRTLEEERQIMVQESFHDRDSLPIVPTFMQEIIVLTTMNARSHPDVDPVKGTSVRMTIDSYENLISQAEERFDRKNVLPVPRISDLNAIRTSMYTKLELNYLTDKSKDQVIDSLLKGAILKVCTAHFARYNWENLTIRHFRVSSDKAGAEYVRQLETEPELKHLVDQYIQDRELLDDPEMVASVTEAVLEGLHLAGKLKKREVEGISGQEYGA